MPNRDAMHDADRHGSEWDEGLHHYDHGSRRMSGGEVFSLAVILGATAYFAYHILRFLIVNHFLGVWNNV